MIGPHIAPVAETAAIAHADVIEITVNDRQRLWPVMVEDDIAEWQPHAALVDDLRAILDESAFDQAFDRRLDPVLRLAGQRAVLVTEIDLALETAAAGRHVVGREVSTMANAGEGNVLVIEVGPLRLHFDPAIETDVDDDYLRTGEKGGGVERAAFTAGGRP